MNAAVTKSRSPLGAAKRGRGARGAGRSAPAASRRSGAVPDIEWFDSAIRKLVDGIHAPPASRVERIWPDKDGQVRIEWTVCDASGARHSVFGVPLDVKYREERSRGRIAKNGICGLRFALEDRELLLHVADTDPKLPHLRDCLDCDAMAARLAEFGLLQTRKSSRPRLRTLILAHKPGRRAAIAYEASDSRRLKWVGKTYRDARAARIADWSRQVARQLSESGDSLRLPAVVGVDESRKLLINQWCDGEAGDARPVEPGPRLKRVARILAALHAVRVDGLPAFSIDEELAIAKRWTKFLRQFDPIAADRAAALFDKLEKCARQVGTQRPCTIHRDFFEKQIIWTRRGPVLLDLDTLTLGNPALDVGNFIGHMLLNRAQAGKSIDDLQQLARAFVSHYRDAGGAVDNENVAFFWASSLVRGGAIHTLRDTTRRFAPAIWAQAERLLAGKVRL